MNPSDSTKSMKPADLTNQLFNAVSQYQKDPHEVARLVVDFLKEALVYALTSSKKDVIVFLTEMLIYTASLSVDDEEARKELFKHIGDTITNAPSFLAGKAETGK